MSVEGPYVDRICRTLFAGLRVDVLACGHAGIADGDIGNETMVRCIGCALGRPVQFTDDRLRWFRAQVSSREEKT